ncbi:MAG: type II toxin-antitoxin system YafQ family toxin [Anaerolineales bacterium]|nr:type II toxin-antitoxin system YafQ family toxin [Anaerolineales bacterium]
MRRVILTARFEKDASDAPDWLLIYRFAGQNEIEMVRTGTHADLFE